MFRRVLIGMALRMLRWLEKRQYTKARTISRAVCYALHRDGLHLVNHPLIACFLTKLRNELTTERDFRDYVSRITKLLIFEATRDLRIAPRFVWTPLKLMAEGCELEERIAFVPVLRAGLGMCEPAVELIPEASIFHIGLARDEQTAGAEKYYAKLEEIAHYADYVIILDPMLATGGSAVFAVNLLKAAHVKKIALVGIIGAPEGLKLMREQHPDVPIYLAALDQGLNSKKYIMPGLGDAGKRQFGTPQ